MCAPLLERDLASLLSHFEWERIQPLYTLHCHISQYSQSHWNWVSTADPIQKEHWSRFWHHQLIDVHGHQSKNNDKMFIHNMCKHWFDHDTVDNVYKRSKKSVADIEETEDAARSTNDGRSTRAGGESHVRFWNKRQACWQIGLRNQFPRWHYLWHFMVLGQNHYFDPFCCHFL